MDGINGVFRGKLIVARGSDAIALGYHLTADGEVHSETDVPPEVEITETIDSLSRLFSSLSVSLEIDLPNRTRFSKVAAAIEKLTNLTSSNAVDSCNVEIVVFPFTPRASSAETGD